MWRVLMWVDTSVSIDRDAGIDSTCVTAYTLIVFLRIGQGLDYCMNLHVTLM